jgi:hypothetical protein
MIIKKKFRKKFVAPLNVATPLNVAPLPLNVATAAKYRKIICR